jgi:hypothetical protein
MTSMRGDPLSWFAKAGVFTCLLASWSLTPDAWGQIQIDVQPRMGQPADGLTPAELARFEEGKLQFDHTFQVGEGLGPTMNQDSCSSCHNNPVGGSGSITVTRFGFTDPKTLEFDPLAELGGSLLQAETIPVIGCPEVIPPEANTQQIRATPSTLGFGLLEAIPDGDIQANADNPPSPNVSGRVHIVEPLEAPGTFRVGRFGWKAQVATVLTFSGDASLNEMGITNDLVMTENAPNGDEAVLAFCDTVADPEDTGPVGTRFIDKITDFQRFLAQPPQTPKSGMTGEVIFDQIGCTDCHIASFTTPDNPKLESALRNKTIKPYSDFLLHDIGGTLFDGIQQGDATEAEIRTPPLWGLRIRDPMLHDASLSGGIFSTRVNQAIINHGQLGSESRPAVLAYQALTQPQKDAVIAFLDSLGRAEFDHTGDNDIDDEDVTDFLACFNGPQGYTPDDACAISDVNQDGNVDCFDYAGLRTAWSGANPPPDLPACAGVIPTVSQWGLMVMTALLGVAGGIVIRKRRAQCPAAA